MGGGNESRGQGACIEREENGQNSTMGPDVELDVRAYTCAPTEASEWSPINRTRCQSRYTAGVARSTGRSSSCQRSHTAASSNSTRRDITGVSRRQSAGVVCKVDVANVSITQWKLRPQLLTAPLHMVQRHEGAAGAWGTGGTAKGGGMGV